ncbi:LacI family DNA-binding transcriptional regulator [Shimia sp.]|uniref:LacI family DNA-binding transcriptional regulator n=1 Tax=Shimia sp. TaxID=1954381 RepID=UPI00329709BF
MVTARDVASEAGVSLTTVSRCFGGGDLVTKKTRERVLLVADRLGYSPNIAGRVLASRRSRLIGLMVDDFNDPENLDLFRFVSAEAQKRNFHAILLNTYRERAEVGSDSIEAALLQQVDGLLVTASHLSQEMIARCAAQDKRVVIVGRKSGHPDFSSVYCDNEDGAAQVADYLFAQGVQRPAFVGANPEATVTLERRSGFVQRIEQLYGMQPIVREAGINDYSKGYAIGQEMLTLPRPPDGYFCATDLLGIGLLDAMQTESGANVDKPPCVVGFGYSMLSRLTRYKLASVALPMEDMVRTATSHLIDTLGDAMTGPERIVFPCELTIPAEDTTPVSVSRP